MKTLLMYLLAMSAGLIWGITFSLARIATEAGLHPLGLSWWQAAGGGTLLLGYAALRGEIQGEWQHKNNQSVSNDSSTPRFRPHIPVQLRAQLRHMVIIGLCGSVVPGTLLFYAAVYIPAGVLAITIALVPILTYLLCILMRSDTLSLRRGSGVLLGFAAIIIIMLPGSIDPIVASGAAETIDTPTSAAAGVNASGAADYRIWILLSLLACCFYTIENIYVDRAVAVTIPMSLLLGGGMLIATLILSPLVFLAGAFVVLFPPFQTAHWALLSMMIVSAAAYLMYLELIRHAGAVFASMSGYIVTLSGVFWGIIFFSEKHSSWIWLALFLMVSGMALVQPRFRQASNY